MSRAIAQPVTLADREAGEALRWIALGELGRARACREALARGEDVEALHDFRVAMRRLRSHLRAYRDEVGDVVRPRTRRRLRRMTAATNPGRDAEVGLELVAGWSAASSGAELRALGRLAADLERRRDTAYEEVRHEVLADFDRTARTLERGLRRYEVELGAPPAAPAPEPFRELLARRLTAHGEELLAALDAAADDSDESRLHAARIAAKRLRYLAEPVLGETAAARPLVEILKQLQDALGSARDLAVLAERLAAAGGRAERDRLAAAAGGAAARPAAGGRSGRLAVARRIAGERETLRRQIERDWLAHRGPRLAALEAAIGALVGSLKETVRLSARSAPEPAA